MQSMSGEDDWAARCRGILEDLRAACGEAVSGDPRQAYGRADALREMWEKGQGLIASARAEAVARLWEAERLSLAQLAGHIGLSRARADQFLRAARPREESNGPLPPDPQRPEDS